LTSLKNVCLTCPIPAGTNTIGDVGIVGEPIVETRTAFINSEPKQFDATNSSQTITFSQDIYKLDIYNNDTTQNNYHIYVSLQGGTPASTTLHIPIAAGEIFTRDIYIAAGTGIQIVSDAPSPNTVDARLEGYF